ncbi:MAG TPA: response regulator [Kofleriaceae bacterium]|nr:response regulator [Kofleriaceae bacterium]
MKILVVDDDRLLSRAIGRTLRGYEYAIENEPERVVERLRSGEHYDLILCDMRMPKMTGGEVVAAIRALCGDDAPAIVLMSGDDADSDASADAFLLKPFGPRELAGVIAATTRRVQAAS